MSKTSSQQKVCALKEGLKANNLPKPRVKKAKEDEE